MTVITGSYTPGCLDSTTRRVLDQEAIDRAYRLEDGHLTRSYAHSVYKGGGLAQEALDNGERLFTGNAGTDFGTLVDRAIPLVVAGVSLEDRFVVPPDGVLSNGARRGKAYTEWKEQNQDRTELSAQDWYRLTRIVANTLRCSASAKILEETRDMQAALRYEDPHGHRRKALVDGVTEGYLWDFKTTSSDWKSLWRSCDEFGYLWQAAWYVDAAMACGWEHHSLKFVFAQTMKPFRVRVVRMPEELVEAAREEIKVCLDQIRLRRQLGEYRAPEDDEETELEFPAFFRGGRNDR